MTAIAEPADLQLAWELIYQVFIRRSQAYKLAAAWLAARDGQLKGEFLEAGLIGAYVRLRKSGSREYEVQKVTGLSHVPPSSGESPTPGTHEYMQSQVRLKVTNRQHYVELIRLSDSLPEPKELQALVEGHPASSAAQLWGLMSHSSLLETSSRFAVLQHLHNFYSERSVASGTETTLVSPIRLTLPEGKEKESLEAIHAAIRAAMNKELRKAFALFPPGIIPSSTNADREEPPSLRHSNVPCTQHLQPVNSHSNAADPSVDQQPAPCQIGEGLQPSQGAPQDPAELPLDISDPAEIRPNHSGGKLSTEAALEPESRLQSLPAAKRQRAEGHPSAQPGPPEAGPVAAASGQQGMLGRPAVPGEARHRSVATWEGRVMWKVVRQRTGESVGDIETMPSLGGSTIVRASWLLARMPKESPLQKLAGSFNLPKQMQNRSIKAESFVLAVEPSTTNGWQDRWSGQIFIMKSDENEPGSVLSLQRMLDAIKDQQSSISESNNGPLERFACLSWVASCNSQANIGPQSQLLIFPADSPFITSHVKPILMDQVLSKLASQPLPFAIGLPFLA